MKKPFVPFLVILLFFPSVLFAQNDDIRIDFYDAEYFLTEEEYRDALFSYKKVYEAGHSDNANVNYRIGICYLNLPGEQEKAIPYLEKAVENITNRYNEGNFKEERAPHDAMLYLGNAYRINYELDKAIMTYRKYMDLIGDSDAEEVKYTEQQIEACNRANVARKNPAYLKKENLGRLYNTGLNNYNAVVSGNGEAMAYMSEQKFYDAVFFVLQTPSGWSNPINITPQIQSDGDQIVTSLSHDGTTMFLARISNFDSDILVSNYSSRVWSKSENIGKPINSKYFESHACLSPDGRKLYFTSNRKESLGQMDIFVSELDEKGKWKEPVNLGPTVNTPLNEESPFIMNDGKTLYFSSQGHETIGGYDIFVTELQENGTWSEPKALPYPANTTDDDVFYYPLEEENAGYMTRYEPDGFGSGDLYKVEILPLSEAPVAEETLSEEAVDEEILAEEQAPDAGRPAKPDSVRAPAPDISPSARYFVKPVFFAFDSYAISDIARVKLDTIVEALQDYPEIKLKVLGHTDSKGPDSYNQRLSEQRARAVIDYLTRNGIVRDRLEFAGFSESKPAARNTNPDGSDSAEGRQLNRRVEFRIVSPETDYVIIREVEVPDNLKIE